MRSKKPDRFPAIAKAVLTKDVSYKKSGIEITVYKGTDCVVDLEANIGLLKGDHVDLSPDEYQVIYFN